MKMVKVIAIILILFVIMVGCSEYLPVANPVRIDPAVLLNHYIKALKARDMELLSTELISPNYFHLRRDGSVEGREAYLQNLQKLFECSIREITVLEQEAETTSTVCKIFVHWRTVLAYGPFNVMTKEIIDKTTLTFKLESGQWRLIEDAPILKDGDVKFSGMSLRVDSFEFLDKFSLSASRIYLWVSLKFSAEFVNLTHQLKLRWYGPKGDLYFENVNLITPTDDSWAYWSPLDVKGSIPEDLLGDWRVEVYFDDLLKLEKSFLLTK